MDNNEKFLELVFQQLMAISKGYCDIDDSAILNTASESQREVLSGLLFLNEDLNLYKSQLEAKMKILEDQNKLLEKIIELKTKNKELLQFNYIASHDLQEPLRNVTTFSKMLENEYSDILKGNGQHYLKYILQSAERMEMLIMDLLDYSRIGMKGEVVSIDCNILLESLISDLSDKIENNNITINCERLPMINGHESEIEMLFLNLINNAIKFRKKNNPTVINIKVVEKDDFWEFCVSDNGIGISEKYYERIFNIFQRLHSKNKYKGTGIGLANCKKIVELHKGDIWVESKEKIGSDFYFTISKDLK